MASAAAALCVALLALSGCAGPTRGTPAKAPTPIGRLFGSATTTEADGLIVLSNGQTGGRGEDTKAWAATDDVELAVLWRGVGRSGALPTLDFSRYVVFGSVSDGSVCQTPILHPLKSPGFREAITTPRFDDIAMPDHEPLGGSLQHGA